MFDAPTAVRSKIETLIWFLQRPPLYKELARRALRLNVRTTGSVERARVDQERGRAWCQSVARPVETMLEAWGLSRPVKRLAEQHPETWKRAHQALEACPIKMGGPGFIDLLYHLTTELAPDRVIETGVASGWSSLAILSALEARGRGQLVSVDMPYAKLGNEDFVGCVVPSELRPRWTLLRLPDRDGLPQALKLGGRLELAHYDSDKSPEGRAFAYPRLWQALEPRGVLMSDDVEDNFAFREFAVSVGQEPWIVAKDKPGNFAGLLRKP